MPALCLLRVLALSTSRRGLRRRCISQAASQLHGGRPVAFLLVAPSVAVWYIHAAVYTVATFLQGQMKALHDDNQQYHLLDISTRCTYPFFTR